jgi:hypothetical protein
MRRLLLIGGATALMALPATALADDDVERVADPDPTAEEGAGATTTKALHAEGRGGFRYEGSGGTVVTGRGVVKVRDLSAGKDLSATPTGFAKTRTSKDGVWTAYIGEGGLTLDGSSYRVTAHGRFASDVDPTASHQATGLARLVGRGETILKGGVAVPIWASQRILLSRGPLSVDLAGRGGHGWFRDGSRGKGGPKARGGKARGGKHRHGLRWRWDRGGPGATWRVNGPASGTVDIATVTGRVRVWDRSAGKDLSVAVPAGTTTTTLGDGSVVYSGLREAKVTLAGTGFRMKVRARDVEGTFTPAAGSLARAFVRGKGTFDTADVTDMRAGKHGGVRILLQPTGTATP